MNSDPGAQTSQLLERLAADSANVDLRIATARSALSSGQIPLAGEIVRAGLASGIADPQLRFLEAYCPMAAGRWEEALGLFRKLRGVDALQAITGCEIAHCELELGRPESGLRTLDELRAEEALAIPRYRVLRAKLLHALRRFDEAIQTLYSYCAEAPADIDAGAFLALVLLDACRFQEAGDAAERVLRRARHHPTAQLVLGAIELQRQQPHLARQHFEAVLKIRPDSGRALSGMGYSAALEGDMTGARDYLLAASQRLSRHLGTWHALAWVQLALKDLAGARASAEQLMQLDRTLADNHGLLAMIDYLEGNAGLAEKSVRRCLKLNPSCSSGLFVRGLLASREGNTAAANDLIKKILAAVGIRGSVDVADALALFAPESGQGDAVFH